MTPCPICGKAAYLGLVGAECSTPKCQNYVKQPAKAMDFGGLASFNIATENPFKPGDRVQCIDANGCTVLTVGQVYTVLATQTDSWTDKHKIELVEMVGHRWWYTNRFAPAPASAHTFKVGDRVTHFAGTDVYEVEAVNNTRISIKSAKGTLLGFWPAQDFKAVP